MDRSNTIDLISVAYTEDSIAQQIPVETLRTVFCAIDSISRAEFYDAGRNGLKPEYRVTLFAPDYNGEEALILNGKRYGIVRTYQNRNETIELYVERLTGELNGEDETQDDDAVSSNIGNP